MLNFETHNPTNDYVNSLISKSFLPVITMPTRVKQQSATLIDHIWTNKVCNRYNSAIILDLLSDHFPVICFGTSGRRCNRSPLGGRLATTLVATIFIIIFLAYNPPEQHITPLNII